MPDWKKLVGQQLSGLDLDSTEREEVHAELGAHLEESYEAFRAEGLTHYDAVQRTLVQIADWKSLQKRIDSVRKGKDTMTNRVTQFWLPGLATFLLSAGILAVMEILGLKAWILGKEGNLPIGVLYGSKRAILLSIVFPVLPFLASILVALPVSLIFDKFIAHNIGPMSLIFALFGWVLAPAAALLAGGLITQYLLSRRSNFHGVASH